MTRSNTLLHNPNVFFANILLWSLALLPTWLFLAYSYWLSPEIIGATPFMGDLISYLFGVAQILVLFILKRPFKH